MIQSLTKSVFCEMDCERELLEELLMTPQDTEYGFFVEGD